MDSDAGGPGPRSAPPADPVDLLSAVDDELDLLEALPTAEHAAVFGRIHRTLGSALAQTGSDGSADPGPAPGPGR